MSGFRDYQSVTQTGVRRGQATRRVPLDPGEVRALFGRMVRRGCTPLLTIASAAGNVVPGRWWSVTITSTPAASATATSRCRPVPAALRP